MKDIFGKALLDFNTGNYTEDIITSTSISEEDILPLPYLFRSFSEMPYPEQKALELCKGSVLDVGCGAGSHALWLQHNEFQVKAIDISEGAIKVSKNRGVKNAQLMSLLDETNSYDTIILLMNGIGVFQSLREVQKYLIHLITLLKPNGQILVDSSDIKYMYSTEVEFEDDTNIEDLNQLNNGKYYGELDYYISYKGENEVPMQWLYLDFTTLKNQCRMANLNCEMVVKGEHYDFLAKITCATN